MKSKLKIDLKNELKNRVMLPNFVDAAGSRKDEAEGIARERKPLR